MYSTQEHFADNQILCWNCEEAVHESASQCPYCNVAIDRHPVQKASTEKITVLPKPKNFAVEKHVEESEPLFGFMISLLLMLSGSALFFLSIIIALFSKDGNFTISWSEHSWSGFFGFGLALLSFGTLFLQKLSEPSEE
jgi:hypothetical protein